MERGLGERGGREVETFHTGIFRGLLSCKLFSRKLSQIEVVVEVVVIGGKYSQLNFPKVCLSMFQRL